MAGKKKTMKGKRKGMGCLAVLVALLSVFLAPPVTTQAAGFTFDAGEKYAIKYMTSINMGATNIDERGGGLNGVIGPLFSLRSGENKVLEANVSIGVALMPDGTTDTQAFGSSAGVGFTWMNDMIGTHWGYRVDPQTGGRVPEFKLMLDLMPLLNPMASAVCL